MVTYSVSLFIWLINSFVLMLLEIYHHYFHTPQNINVFLLLRKINTGLVERIHMSLVAWPLRKTPICSPSPWRGPASHSQSAGATARWHFSASLPRRRAEICKVAAGARRGGGVRRCRPTVSQSSAVGIRRDGGPTILNIACRLNDTVCIVMTSGAPAGLLNRESD